MKKITIALMCMLLTAGAAMAQKKFTFGPKIGVDYTHFWDNEVDASGQFNYQAGLFMEYRFTDKFSIAPEVVFAAQGGKFNWYNESSIKISTTDHMNYVNIPVMLKYYVTPALSIDLGPQLGINVYSKYTVESKDKHLNIKETEDQKDDTKTIDVGVGLGFTYNIAKDVFVQGRYTLGLTEVFDKSWDTGKNGNAQIAIGYRF